MFSRLQDGPHRARNLEGNGKGELFAKTFENRKKIYRETGKDFRKLRKELGQKYLSLGKFGWWYIKGVWEGEEEFGGGEHSWGKGRYSWGRGNIRKELSY